MIGPASDLDSAGDVVPVLRVCLDLNVWVANLLATRLGRSDTAAQSCAAAAQRGLCALGRVQLVISWGMVTRLRAVLEDRLAIPRETADPYLAALVASARVGPPGAPLIVLGGTGAMPIRDAEDAHVVDVAIAGRADLIVTANFVDFLTYRTVVLRPNRLAVLPHAAGQIVVAHPAEVAAWLRTGQTPSDILPRTERHE